MITVVVVIADWNSPGVSCLDVGSLDEVAASA